MEVRGNQELKVEGVEIINRTQIEENRLLKAQHVEGVELIIEIYIRRKFISSRPLPITISRMREDAYKQGISSRKKCQTKRLHDTLIFYQTP